MKVEIKDIIDQSLELQSLLKRIASLWDAPTDNAPQVLSDIMQIDEDGVKRNLIVNYYDMEHSFLGAATLQITTSGTSFVINGELATLSDLDVFAP